MPKSELREHSENKTYDLILPGFSVINCFQLEYDFPLDARGEEDA